MALVGDWLISGSVSERRLPQLSSGQWITVGVIAFIVVAIFFDVANGLRQLHSDGPPQAQLNGTLPHQPLVVGRETSFQLALDDTAGGAMNPACVGGNLTPEFKVVKVTFLGSRGSSWAHARSCGAILETNSTVPVVISVVPRSPGTYSLSLRPQQGSKRVGSGTKGVVRIVR